MYLIEGTWILFCFIHHPAIPTAEKPCHKRSRTCRASSALPSDHHPCIPSTRRLRCKLTSTSSATSKEHHWKHCPSLLFARSSTRNSVALAESDYLSTPTGRPACSALWEHDGPPRGHTLSYLVKFSSSEQAA